MNLLFWQEFGILFGSAILGSAAVIPYGLRLVQDKPLPFSTPVLYALSMLQNAVLFGVIVALGIEASHAAGFGAPYIEALLTGVAIPSSEGLLVALALGIIAGAILLIGDLFFVPYWPQALIDTARRTTLSENFFASFYGGINEELLMRFFGFSALISLMSFIFHTSTATLWIANIIMTILFGLGHLPALKQLLGTISNIMLARTLLLNAPVGLVCGWLFWMYGIEAAIIAHFWADIVYHVFGTIVLRQRIK